MVVASRAMTSVTALMTPRRNALSSRPKKFAGEFQESRPAVGVLLANGLRRPVTIRVQVYFGQIVHGFDWQTQGGSERGRGVLRAHLRAADDEVDAGAGQMFGKFFSLPQADLV